MPLSKTGFIITPSQNSILEARQILIDTYGPNVNIDPAGPNGLFIQNVALAITKRESDQADIINSINPNIAEGTQLDAICSNLEIIRIPATKSNATCEFTGLPATIIPAFAQVLSTNGDIFLTDSFVVIDTSGIATMTVTAQKSGPIKVDANTIQIIITGFPGWTSINNSSAGNVGVSEENDVQLRARRLDQLAFASSGSIQSIKAGITTFNPTSSYVIENNTSSNIVRDGITILKNSVLLVVEGGGSDTQVANMFLQRLSAGCAMSGSRSFTVPIKNSSESFTANWQIASQKVLGLNILLKLGAVYPANLPDLVASIVNELYDFDVIGEFVDATEFIFLLISKGIQPIRSLTFNVGSLTNLTQYTMPISDSLGSSLLATNVSINYV